MERDKILIISFERLSMKCFTMNLVNSPLCQSFSPLRIFNSPQIASFGILSSSWPVFKECKEINLFISEQLKHALTTYPNMHFNHISQ